VPPGGFAPSGPTPAPAVAPSDAQTVRFLAQSTFGATPSEISRFQQLGYSNWLEQQFLVTRTPHLDFVLAAYPIPTPMGVTVTIDPLYQSFWKQAITSPDQLRQRVTYALSQILVISGVEQDLSFVPTVFDRLEPDLVAALVYRGWWLTGAALAKHQPGFALLPPGVTPPTRVP
jgi:hypothetical protein